MGVAWGSRLASRLIFQTDGAYGWSNAGIETVELELTRPSFYVGTV